MNGLIYIKKRETRNTYEPHKQTMYSIIQNNWVIEIHESFNTYCWVRLFAYYFLIKTFLSSYFFLDWSWKDPCQVLML